MAEFRDLIEGYDRRLLTVHPGFLWLAVQIVNMFSTQFVWTPETYLGRRPAKGDA